MSRAFNDKCPGDTRFNRKYEYPGVPMYKELLIKSSGNTATDGWRDLYTYNLYIGDGDPDLDVSAMTYQRDVKAFADTDFSLISILAGVAIPSGNGSVIGEVHDCDNYRVQNAIVDINRPRWGLSCRSVAEVHGQLHGFVVLTVRNQRIETRPRLVPLLGQRSEMLLARGHSAAWFEGVCVLDETQRPSPRRV